MGNRSIELSDVILDIAAGPFGSNLKKSCFQEDGFPIIDGANLKGFKVTDNITKFVTEEKARSLHRSIAKRNDVVVTISGTLGQISYIPEDSEYEEYLCSQRQFRVTFDTTRVYVPYLVFYFHTYEGQNKILSFANQVGVPALAQPLKNFRKIKIDLPEIEEQKKIASIIELLNNKIENNDAINNNLYHQLDTIYQSIYPYLPSDELPDGWTCVPVGTLCDSISVKHSFDKENLIFLNTGDIENGQFLHETYSLVADMPGQAKKSIKVNDILYSEIRPINRHFAFVNFNADDYVVSTKLMVIRAYNINARRLYHFLTMQETIRELQIEAESRSGTFPQIRFENVQRLPIVIAPPDVELQFAHILEDYYKMIDSNIRQNQQLITLRDNLLSKLMSGEIDVSDIQL